MLSSILTFWTTLAPLVLFLQILCEILFKNILQIVKGKWIRFLRSIFKIWNFLPLIQMLFPLTKQNSPQWNSPLSVQDSFRYCFWKGAYQFEIISKIRYQLKNFLNTNWTFLKLVVVRSFCFGLILSPPLAWIAKNWYLWVKYKPLEVNFLPLW